MIQHTKGELIRILTERLSELTANERIRFEKKFAMEGSINTYSKKDLAAMIRRCAQMAAQEDA